MFILHFPQTIWHISALQLVYSSNEHIREQWKMQMTSFDHRFTFRSALVLWNDVQDTKSNRIPTLFNVLLYQSYINPVISKTMVGLGFVGLN